MLIKDKAGHRRSDVHDRGIPGARRIDRRMGRGRRVAACAAGAVILGKTNMSEWANFRSRRSTSGWSGRGGLVLNPYALDRNPCGSSSGTASAIAANLAAVGVGTETDGSIVCPSAATALVGVKPTLGLVSRSGIIPIAHSQDIAGPMTRTVEDAVISVGRAGGSRFQRPGNDDRRPPPGRVSRRPRQQRASRSQVGVARARFFGYSAVTDRIAETAIADMRAEGAIIIDPANIPNLGKYDASELEVLLYEFKADLNKYLGALGPQRACTRSPMSSRSTRRTDPARCRSSARI